MKIGRDDIVRSSRGMGDPTRHLFHVELSSAIEIQRKYLIFELRKIAVECESRRWRVSELNFALREVDRATIESAGCACLESPDCKTQLSKIFA